MEREMKKIIAIAACLQILAVTGLMMASSAGAADQKAKMVVAKVEDKSLVSATVSKPRAAKVSATEYDYALERDGCCYTR
jgi:hypothetical protein